MLEFYSLKLDVANLPLLKTHFAATFKQNGLILHYIHSLLLKAFL